MEQEWQNDAGALTAQAIPQKDVEQACFHALGLVGRNCEYLEQHLARVGADEQTRQAVNDISAAAARLARNGIDYELVPCEVLKADTAKDGALHLNGMQFRALVIPYAEALPVALLENVQRYLDAGVKVYFVGGLPIRCCEGGPAPVLEHAVVTTLDALVETLTADSIPALHLSAAAPYLRYYHARQADGDV